MENKDILNKIAAIYENDPEKGKSFLRMLFKAEGDPPDSSEPSPAMPSSVAKPKAVSKHKDWKPREDLTEEHAQAIKQHMDDGYSEREAHRFAGAHSEHGSFTDAIGSGVKPSMPSDKMIDHLKDLAKTWLNNADKHDKLNAEVDKNPMKYAAGKMMSAHDEHMGDYKKAYNDFLSSDSVKELKGRKRHEAIKQWKKDWREQNPDHGEKISSVSQSQEHVGSSRQAMKQSLEEKLSNILTGGFAPDETYSAQEGAQQAGISMGGEGEQATGTVSKDPMSAFAGKNKRLMDMLSQEQRDRLERIKSAGAAQGKSRESKPAEKRTVLRRKKDAKE